MEITNKTGIKTDRARCLCNLASLEIKIESINQAEILYEECLEIYQHAGYRNDESEILRNIAEIRESANELEKAKKLLLRSFDISREIENDNSLMVSSTKLMTLSLSMNNLNQSLKYGELVLDLVEKTGIRLPGLEGLPAMLDTSKYGLSLNNN